MLSADGQVRNRLKEIRSGCGLTQAAFAERVGVSGETINTVENGVFVPSVLLALKVARVLGATVEALFAVGAAQPDRGWQMAFFILKAVLSGIIIALVSTIARRSPAVGALVASLPLISILGMLWLWQETKHAGRMEAHVSATL
jgi:DNA-binding XRE family transcriptional regulator